jgi:hypothetical protein
MLCPVGDCEVLRRLKAEVERLEADNLRLANHVLGADRIIKELQDELECVKPKSES